jgi:hypothetical protein
MDYKFFLVVALSLLLIFTPSRCNAVVDNLGIAPYAIQKDDFPCRALINAFKNVDEVHLSFLYRTFGNNNKCLKKFMRDERLQTLQIHVMNEVCVRKGNCGKYESLAGIHKNDLDKKLRNSKKLWKRIEKHAFKLRELLDENLGEQTQCMISPLLESQYVGEKAARKVFRKFRNWFPECAMVWNPVSAQFLPKGADFLETHGRNAMSCGYCISNLDGTDINFVHRRSFLDNYINENQLPKYIKSHKRNVVNFLWTTECNCMERRFKDPRKRKCENNKVYKKMGQYIRRFRK